MAMLETPQAEGVQTKADRANYRTNYEQAFGHTDARIGRSGRHVWLGEEWTHVDDIPAAILRLLQAKTRKKDATNIVSSNLACLPRQIPEWNRKIAKAGLSHKVKLRQKDPHNVEVVMKDCQARRAFEEARGVVNLNDLRSGKNH